jgi:hypothetical protein
MGEEKMRIGHKEREKPQITLTQAGKESIVLRTLIRRTIPMLASPERYPAHERRELAQNLCAVLETTLTEDAGEADPSPCDRDAPREEEPYEPGCLLEMPGA